jgi:hypothetical protein
MCVPAENCARRGEPANKQDVSGLDERELDDDLASRVYQVNDPSGGPDSFSDPVSDRRRDPGPISRLTCSPQTAHK